MLASVAAEASGGARDIELATASEIETDAREVERFALKVEIRARDPQALLRAAQVEVAARDLGRDEHLRVAQVGFGRRGVGGRGLCTAAHAAEQVELPECGEPDVVRFDVDALVAEARLLRLALAARGFGADAGPALAARGAQDGARFVDACGGDLEIEVARERALDEVVERGVAELPPPGRLERLLVEDRRIRVAVLGHGRVGRAIVGPYRARGEQQRRRHCGRPARQQP